MVREIETFTPLRSGILATDLLLGPNRTSRT